MLFTGLQSKGPTLSVEAVTLAPQAPQATVRKMTPPLEIAGFLDTRDSTNIVTSLIETIPH